MSSSIESAVGFVEVLDEPCHRPFLRNAFVNLFAAKLARNNMTMFHRHKEKTVYVVISGSFCRNQLLGAEFRDQKYITGNCFFGDHKQNPLIHRVECTDDSPSDAWFIGCEILQRSTNNDGFSFLHPSYTAIPELTNLDCNGYRLKLLPGATTDQHTIPCSGVFISLTCGELEFIHESLPKTFPWSADTIPKGHTIWFEGPVKFSIKNVGKTSYEAIVLMIV